MTQALSINRIAAVLLIFFALALSAGAHAGGTDSNGGHYNSATGSYHYHHGYPAHQHTNGSCPYDFSDNTSESFSDGVSDLVPWFFVGGTVIVCIAVLAHSAKSEKEKMERAAEEKTRAEQAERERQKKQRALKEEEERLQKEAKARAEQEQEEKLRNLHNTYDGKHILSFVDIPEGSEIGSDNLPKEVDTTENWGKLYTFYVTKNGASFHTKDCRYAYYGRPRNALTVSRDHAPCKLCGAKLPPLEWVEKYRRIKQFATAYKLDIDFTPLPTWYPPFVIRADRTVLSKSFIANLDPARVKRAIEENFTITESEDKKSATIAHGSKEEGYTTTLERCACRDNSFRHAICKHMIALAIHKDVLEIKESKL